MVIKKSTLVFAAVVIALLVVCVGLLVALLRSQNELASHHDKPEKTTTKNHGTPTRTPSSDPHTESLVSTSTPVLPGPWLEPRLPTNVKPIEYDLTLNPDLDEEDYTGNVKIHVSVNEATEHIIVHKKRLEIDSAKVFSADGTEVRVVKQLVVESNEYYVLFMERTLEPAKYTVEFDFHGPLNGSIVGFYKSTYTNRETNQTRNLATSKFQPTFARRAFPCFDEPSMKAIFTVTLIHKGEYKALSNMPVKTSTRRPDGMIETKFETSVAMVTYLACFIVCDFEGKEQKFVDSNKTFTVYATPDQIHKTKTALDYGVKILKFYEDYFGIEYPLPKQDMIAIPDFSSGAMEHWGLITYRETNLLYDEGESSPQNLQRVISVISHELAHMWFGNLVTMEWWNDLWLNEGFASYIEYKGVEHVTDGWMMMDQLLTEDIQPVIRIDSTTSSRPIIQEVNNTNQITEIFDAISYNKGAAVLRMLENFISPKTFQKGISNFLLKYEYQNAKTDDLWAELSNESGQNITATMDTWTRQMGLPVVSVERIANTNKFSVKQQRFLLNPSMRYEKEESPFGYLWKIPLSYVTSKNQENLIMFSEPEDEIEIPGIGPDDWVKFNKGQTGYYLVNYKTEDWETFRQMLMKDHEILSSADRSNLLFDAFQLAQSGAISYDIPLRMITYLMNERHLTPWETAYSSLVQLGHLFQDAHGHKEYKEFLGHLTQPLYRTLGWKAQTNHTDSLLQTTIIGLACYSGNSDCRQQAVQKLKALKNEGTTDIPLALRNIVFKYAMEESGSEELWDWLWERYVAEGSAQERVKLLYGLAHVRNEDLVRRLLNKAMARDSIRDQDFFTVLTYVAGNNVGRPLVWELVSSQWPELVKRFGLDDRFLGRAVKSICDYFNTPAQLKAMEDFFAKYPDAGAGARAREQALENVKTNIKWLEDNQPSVTGWLSKNSWSDFRLTDDVVPLEYDLTLQPDIEEVTFNGTVDILVELKKETDLFIVHIYNLVVTSTSVVLDADQTELDISSTFAHKANDFWVTELKKPVASGSKVWLKYTFEGFLNNSLVGMYRSSYQYNNQPRYLVTSQFQSTYARRAFPCFDEPKFKSEFTVNLIHGEDFHALSNMPPMGSPVKQTGGLVKTTFKKSVKMVTYLVCVIISDFEYLGNTTSQGVEVRVFARPEEKNKTQYALDVAVQTLDYFSDYFDIKYPLDKLDMIAIPDFQAGAMENWGLVTYRETLLLYDPAANSAYNQYRIAAVIGHELAHMWFGNLVTMKWWSDLWLNEGFASYMEYKSMHHVEPTWDVDTQFYLEDVQRVMQPDASITSHPIVQEVKHPDEISALFDAISYSKGASVLRMLEFFLGPEVFKAGVSKYLKTFQYENAETADLWNYLQQAADESKTTRKSLNVSQVMDTWTRQMGYPCVEANKIGTAGGVSTYQLKQERFLLDADVKQDEKSPYGYKWEIPISQLTSGSSGESDINWLSGDTLELKINVGSPPWVKFNPRNAGYYIVNYSQEEWKGLIQQLLDDHVALKASDRSNLISDAFLLARSGRLSYETALDLLKYLKKETHYVPWETARRSLAYIQRVLQQKKHTDGELKGYLDTLSRDAFAGIVWGPIEGHLERRLRETLVDIACSNENQECLGRMATMLREWLELNATVDPDLRLSAYKFGMREIGDENVWNQVWKTYEEEKTSQEQRNLLYGLASTRNISLLSQLLTNAEDGEKIRKQDYFTVIGYVAGNPVGLPLVWKYFRDNWKKLVERFTIGDRYLGDAVKTICNYFTTEERLEEMKRFFKEHPEAGAGERSRQEALANVHSNILWLKKHENTIHKWLERQDKMPWHNIRLTRDVIPSSYDLRLHPSIDQGLFSGTVSIDVKVGKPTKYLLVHAHMLNINDCSVTDSSGNEVPKKGAFLFRRNEYWVIELVDETPAGDYKLHYEFDGSLLGGLVGFYRSSYVDANTNQTKHLATSQFQSTYARRAFPCFDEPSIKSSFTVTLVHYSNMTALSNMPVQSNNSLADDLIETKFETSVPMVTYLVCVVVCDFEYTEDQTNKNVTIRVYAPPDRYHQTSKSLEAGKKVLEFFEEYFKVDFPLPKLDMIALPDFRAGAMENWGLITYREVYLLYDKNETSPSVEYSIFMIIAHEIAHMWFGNLVTMNWWDDLWLNEGFATYMAHKCLDTIRPDMDPIGLFLLGETADVLEPDATHSSHPIVQPVNHPDEISAIFDPISYSKGASVLRLLETFLQPEVFREGLTNYLTKYQFQNAYTRDLWDELSQVYDQGNVSSIMDTWTGQMGYPVVRISIQGSSVKLSQKRFLLNPAATPPDDDHSPHGYVWSIPIHIKDEKKENLIWLHQPEDTITLPVGLEGAKMLKFNYRQAGYYLVNYDTDIWAEWAAELQKNRSIVENLDRSNILSDAFLLAKAGELNYTLVLDLTKYLSKEDDFISWTTAKTGLLEMASLLEGHPTHDSMMIYLRSLTSEIFNKLQWDDSPDEDYMDRRLRAGIADLACRAENQECLYQANKKLENFLTKDESIPSALRSLIYRYGLWKDTDASLWDLLWKKFINENSAQAKRDLLYGLAFARGNEQIIKFLNLAKDESNVRSQDFLTVLSSIGNNPEGLQIVWDFIRDDWQFLVNRYSINDRSLGNVILSVAGHFSTEDRLQEMKKFFADNPESGAGKAAREEALEIMENKIKWGAINRPTVEQWLRTNAPAA